MIDNNVGTLGASYEGGFHSECVISFVCPWPGGVDDHTRVDVNRLAGGVVGEHHAVDAARGG